MFFSKEWGNPEYLVESSSTKATVNNIIPAIMFGAKVLWTLEFYTKHFFLQSVLGLNELC